MGWILLIALTISIWVMGAGGCHVTLLRTLRKQQPEQGITVTGGFHVITFTRPPPEVITAVAKKSLPLPMSVTVIILYEYNKKEFPLYCCFFPPLLFGTSLFPTFFPFILDLAGNIRLLPDHFILSIKLAGHWFRANFSTGPSTCTSWITITPRGALSLIIHDCSKRKTKSRPGSVHL